MELPNRLLLFLSKIDEAKKYFQKYEELSGEKEEFLETIEISQKYKISLEEAFEGGNGGRGIYFG